jgi:hypothetical protein
MFILSEKMDYKPLNNHIKSTSLDRQLSGPCVVIGSGPSGGSLKLHPQWRNYYSITCNWSQNHFPSHMTFYQDPDFIHKTKSVFEKHKCFPCCINSKSKKAIVKKKLTQFMCGYYVERIPHGMGNWIETKNSDIIQTTSPVTGIIAIATAYCWGFDPIILVGFDIDKQSKYEYYKPHYKFGKINHQSGDKFGSGIYNFLNKHKEKLHLINCGTSDWGPQINIKEALNNLQPNYSKTADRVEEIIFSAISKLNPRLLKKKLSQKRLH